MKAPYTKRTREKAQPQVEVFKLVAPPPVALGGAWRAGGLSRQVDDQCGIPPVLCGPLLDLPLAAMELAVLYPMLDRLEDG